MRGLPGGCACGGDQGRGENRELPQGAQAPGSGADAAPGIAPAPVTACQRLVLRSRNHARRRARRKHWRRTGLACRRPWNEHIWNIRLQQWPSIASSMQAGSRRHATMCDTGKSFWFRPTRQSIRGPALRSPETLRLGLRRPGSYACETRPAQLVGIAVPGSLLTAALGTVESGGSPERPERGEGAAKRLDAPLPTAHPVSHMS